MMPMDYDKVYLSERERNVMNDIRYGAVLRLHIVEAKYLLSMRFIAPYALSEQDDEYVVTAEGCRYMEYLDQKQQEKKLSEIAQKQKEAFDRKATWASIIISNLIALAALIVSIVK
ncbi:hypothetical protein B5G28_08505 [Faecalibacterium sp. An77]|uniref:hypothetical protein n=1 Tax=Faecalibacterium sp. An77 TaxID=1965655 RepID=UPI000B36C6C2|nr:hypothetical protein [Faecalibacterium sp. An77]OUN38624.1 hypothetical protein B5G28_08505 [Faecalibacterium sp. An77]